MNGLVRELGTGVLALSAVTLAVAALMFLLILALYYRG